MQKNTKRMWWSQPEGLNLFIIIFITSRAKETTLIRSTTYSATGKDSRTCRKIGCHLRVHVGAKLSPQTLFVLCFSCRQLAELEWIGCSPASLRIKPRLKSHRALVIQDASAESYISYLTDCEEDMSQAACVACRVCLTGGCNHGWSQTFFKMSQRTPQETQSMRKISYLAANLRRKRFVVGIKEQGRSGRGEKFIRGREGKRTYQGEKEKQKTAIER